MINFYFKLIEERSKAQPMLPSVLALETFFLNILGSQSEKNFVTVSAYAHRGDIFMHDIVLMPLLHNKHFSLYVSMSDHMSNNTSY